MLDSFWRAAAYCVHPRVIGLSFLPLVLMVVVSFGLGYFFWENTVASVAAWLESYQLMQAFLGWLERIGMGSLRTVFAPLFVLILATPVIVVACLLLVAVFMTPAMVDMVGRRRFAGLELKHGGSLVVSILWSLGSTSLAVLALVVSMPLWLIPPLVLVLPPVIWGWLTYRVFAFDALASHASVEERKTLAAPEPQQPVADGDSQRVHGCRAQPVVGLGRLRDRAGARSGSCGDLDLHPDLCLCVFVVCPFLPGRAGPVARAWRC